MGPTQHSAGRQPGVGTAGMGLEGGVREHETGRSRSGSVLSHETVCGTYKAYWGKAVTKEPTDLTVLQLRVCWPSAGNAGRHLPPARDQDAKAATPHIRLHQAKRKVQIQTRAKCSKIITQVVGPTSSHTNHAYLVHLWRHGRPHGPAGRRGRGPGAQAERQPCRVALRLRVRMWAGGRRPHARCPHAHASRTYGQAVVRVAGSRARRVAMKVRLCRGGGRAWRAGAAHAVWVVLPGGSPRGGEVGGEAQGRGRRQGCAGAGGRVVGRVGLLVCRVVVGVLMVGVGVGRVLGGGHGAGGRSAWGSVAVRVLAAEAVGAGRGAIAGVAVLLLRLLLLLLQLLLVLLLLLLLLLLHFVVLLILLLLLLLLLLLYVRGVGCGVLLGLLPAGLALAAATCTALVLRLLLVLLLLPRP